MIPKLIHYCWFGANPMGSLAQKCIDSWIKYLPDYELRLWNEDNFNLDCCVYVQQAYQAKKYAFVSDYVRLFVLKEYGGIYMDTDVEVLKSLDPFLKHKAFSGFEDGVCIPTGIIGASKGHPWIDLLFNEYRDLEFIKDDGTYNLVTNVTRITKATMEYSPFRQDNTYQELRDGLVIYPKQVFCPKDPQTDKIKLTPETHTIHHFNGSWATPEQRVESMLIKTLTHTFGDKLGWKLFGAYKSIKQRRFWQTMKKNFKG